MSGESVSLEEFARAFTRMLPNRGDVLLNSRSSRDSAVLAAERIFALQPSGMNSMQYEVNLVSEMPLIARNFDATRIPLPPRMFAGAWLRFENALDIDVISESARLLVPGGLMVVVASCAAKPIELTSQVRANANVELNLLGKTRVSVSGDLSLMLLARAVEEINAGTEDPRCEFCTARRFTANMIARLPGAAATLWGDEHFFVIPDVAPTQLGHLLLLPTRHYLSMGAIPHGLVSRLEDHIQYIHTVMRVAFGRTAIFIEHGAVRPHEAGSCIDHAHWHCLPDEGSIFEQLARRDMRGEAGHFSDTMASYNNGDSYFLVRNRDGHWLFTSSGLPCQFLRLLTAKGVSGDNLRWQRALRSANSRVMYYSTLSAVLEAADAVMLPGYD